MQTINHWQVVTVGKPQEGVRVVLGYLGDGQPVRTSQVQQHDLEQQQVTTRNSVYRLGQPAAPQS